MCMCGSTLIKTSGKHCVTEDGVAHVRDSCGGAHDLNLLSPATSKCVCVSSTLQDKDTGKAAATDTLVEIGGKCLSTAVPVAKVVTTAVGSCTANSALGGADASWCLCQEDSDPLTLTVRDGSA